MKQLYVKNVNGIFTPIDDVPAASVQADAASCDSGCRLNPTGDPQNDCGNCALATVPQDIGRDAALKELLHSVLGNCYMGEEREKFLAEQLLTTPPANVAQAAPSTLAQQVASAQAETDAWPDGKLARVKLAGGDQP